MRRQYVISRPEQIGALASAVRQDIVDAVTAIGRSTAPEIARSLGRRPDGLYFHLRHLVKVGLLEEGERPNGNGRMTSTYDVPGRPLRIKYDLAGAVTARALNRVAASMLRTANRSFARATGSRRARIDGPKRELWAARIRGRLTEAQLTEVNQLLHRVIALVGGGETPENACSYEVTFVLSPSRSV
jgi:YD repeat-containing protein